MEKPFVHHPSVDDHAGQIPASAHKIELATGETAWLYMYRRAIVTDLDPLNESPIYTYRVPCPNATCKALNNAHSYDGTFFTGHQIACRLCGAVFVPRIRADGDRG